MFGVFAGFFALSGFLDARFNLPGKLLYLQGKPGTSGAYFAVLFFPLVKVYAGMTN
jgi:hypothetical protein